jgi:hypothetical protein
MMISAVDDLPIRPVGERDDKIYWLVQYFGIFTGGMTNRWSALSYVEIGSEERKPKARDSSGN